MFSDRIIESVLCFSLLYSFCGHADVVCNIRVLCEDGSRREGRGEGGGVEGGIGGKKGEEGDDMEEKEVVVERYDSCIHDSLYIIYTSVCSGDI